MNTEELCHISMSVDISVEPYRTLCGEVREELDFVTFNFFKEIAIFPSRISWCPECLKHESVQLWLLTQV